VLQRSTKSHLEVERLRYVFVRMPIAADRDLVSEVCKQHANPTPVVWQHGHLDVSLNWHRIASDEAYVGGKPYLTVVDWGPSRFAIWTALINKTADQAIRQWTMFSLLKTGCSGTTKRANLSMLFLRQEAVRRNRYVRVYRLSCCENKV